MTSKEFKTKMREERGRLKSMESELDTIYVSGSKELINYMLNGKAIGLARGAFIAEEFNHDDQKEIIKRIHDYPGKVKIRHVELILAAMAIEAAEASEDE